MKLPDILGLYSSSVAACDNKLYISGQLPIVNGQLLYKGKVGLNINIEQAKQCATVSILRIIDIAKKHYGEKLPTIYKMTIFINSVPKCCELDKIVTATLALLPEVKKLEVIDLDSLPKGSPIEIDAIFDGKI